MEGDPCWQAGTSPFPYLSAFELQRDLSVIFARYSFGHRLNHHALDPFASKAVAMTRHCELTCHRCTVTPTLSQYLSTGH